MERRPSPLYRVLVVEDDPALATMVQDLLQLQGYEIALAGSGCAALTLLQCLPDLPDAILLDLMMPDMDGINFRAVQNQHAQWRTIPVIVVTAAHRGVVTAMDLDVTACVVKPFMPADLFRILDEVVRAGEPRHHEGRAVPESRE